MEKTRNSSESNNTELKSYVKEHILRSSVVPVKITELENTEKSLKSKINALQQELEELERLDLQFHDKSSLNDLYRYQLELYKRISNLTFDLESTSKVLRGFISHKSLKTFDFDLEKDSPCFVSDHLWTLIEDCRKEP